MKTYTNSKVTFKCYTNTKGDKYFIKIENPDFIAKYEFSNKDVANQFFKENTKNLGLKIKVSK